MSAYEGPQSYEGLVTPERMEGDSPLEKELNAFLTIQFILSRDVPSDECLSEAKEIVQMFRRHGWISGASSD